MWQCRGVVTDSEGRFACRVARLLRLLRGGGVFKCSCAVFRGKDMASRLTNGVVRARDGGRGAMTTTGALQAELSDLFANMLHVQVPSPDTDLLATARLDSVGMVELLLQIEKRFGVRVDMRDFEIDNFRSLSAIAAFVAERRGDQTPVS